MAYRSLPSFRDSFITPDIGQMGLPPPQHQPQQQKLPQHIPNGNQTPTPGYYPQIPMGNTTPSIAGNVQSISQTTNSVVMPTGNSVNPVVYDASQRVPIPPYATLKPTGQSMRVQRPKRSKRRSKFTQEQDDIITSMKRQGKTWMEIADAAGVESYLAARNRYQVLIGQQGGGTSECGPEEVVELQSILDEAELEKLRFICKEFKKSTGRAVDSKDVRELLRMLFWRDPSRFDFDSEYLRQLAPLQQQRQEEFRGDDREEGTSDIGE